MRCMAISMWISLRPIRRKVSMFVMAVVPLLSLCVYLHLRSFLASFTYEGLHNPIVSILKGKSDDGREERGDNDRLKDNESQLPRRR